MNHCIQCGCEIPLRYRQCRVCKKLSMKRNVAGMNPNVRRKIVGDAIKRITEKKEKP